MTGRSKILLRYMFSGALTLLLLYLAFRDANPDALWRAMQNADYRWLIVMFLLLMTSHLLRSWRWRYLLEPIKPGIGMRSLFSGVMIGYLMNNILPRAGEFIRPYAVSRLESISRGAALGTIVVERIMDGISFLLLLAIIPLVYDGPLREVFPWLAESGIILSAVLIAFLGLMIVLMVRRDWMTNVFVMAERILPASPVRYMQRAAHSFLDGFLFLKNPRNYLIIAGLSAGIWGLYIVMMYAAFVAFHIHHQLGWRAAVVVLTISSIGVAVPTPGSTGGYHVFTSQTLTKLFFIPDDVSLGYATLTHAVGYIGVSLVGLYFLLRDHIRISDAVKNEGETSR